MTNVLITIDTEYSAGMVSRLGIDCREENFLRSISCKTATGSVGIEYQMDRFDQHGLKAVFFVDPMPALVWGIEAVADVVGPIVSRGHEVQLHMHPEWLEYAGANNPLGERIGRNIGDFSFEDQCILLEKGRDILVSAGAPVPIAFRAGNYGANDNTLRALSEIGISIDTSLCPGIANSECGISLSAENDSPTFLNGTIEMPIHHIEASHGGKRHFQLTALSAREILAACDFAHNAGLENVILVSHSFELLSRDRSAINLVVKRRFEAVCQKLGSRKGLLTRGFRDLGPIIPGRSSDNAILPHSPFRTLERIAEQTVSNFFFGRR